ncbi:DUF411 domain-containing protein [Paracoccus zhejiangensis]|uniref:CopG family transcriptional regulator n=1 Tax=Paracoccus zhejiangensis TaxID=1077935 RepID=A0A2H5F188_9RHOB|nr:DUF411 domain-containing protein [Paracoccus zhejiangensis]AUH65311.1 CopG family transcriptional regulator [Paracoccus zhejiangensis]
MNKSCLSRRGAMLAMAAALATSSTLARAATGSGERPNLLSITKDPGCDCCGAWADLAIEAGFEVEITETADYEGMKRAAKVPEKLWSCHTARIDGYVVEGHVPFAAIRQLLQQRPDLIGIAVPGMPAGSPGMGGGVDATADVIAWGGSAGVWRPFPSDE